MFAKEAKVNVENALGYKAKSTYCVAPIIDDETDIIYYWAAGTDCCGQRASFTCDDVWNPRARAAVVLTDNNGQGQDADSDGREYQPQNARENATQIAIDNNGGYSGGSTHAMFLRAARQAAAAYGLRLPPKPLFVRWVRDPQLVQNNYLHDGKTYIGYSVGGAFFLSVVMGWIAHLSTRRSGNQIVGNVQLPQAP